VDDTQEIQERERDLLRCHPCDYFPLTSGTHLTVPHKRLQQLSGPVFKFLAPGLIFGCTEGVGSRFHVLRTRNRFQRCRVRQVPFSCFALLDSFSAVSRALGSFFMFCSPELIFGGFEGVGSRFHVLLSRTRFRRYRGRRVPFSCFARPDSFSAVSSASGPFFMFCALGLIFSGTEGVGYRFQVLRAGLVFGGTENVGSRFPVLHSRTHFRLYRGRRVPFSCFARPESFSAVPSASGPLSMFCAPRLIFGGIEGVGFLFHVLPSRTGFWRYRGRPIPFSCFARPDSFSAVRRASGLVFKFCAPELVFGGTEGVGSRFHVLRSRTRFRRYRWRRVPFSCFSRPDSFSATPRASGLVFMFCAPRLVFGANEGVGSRFHVLRSRTRFRWYRRRLVPF
jgi:hypothetical protein